MSKRPKKCLTCVFSMLWNLCEDLKKSRRYRLSAACLQESLKPWIGLGADGLLRKHS